MNRAKLALSQRFEDALMYAVKLHAQKIRKGSGVPYVSHILGVASIAIEYGAKEDEAIAALLHDAIEDQGGDKTRLEIRKRFGQKVVDIVNGCTDTDVKPKPPWKKRKEDYIAHIRHANKSVRLVSAADKLHNIQTIIKDYRKVGSKVWKRFNGSKVGTLWYYRTLVNELLAAERSPLAEELDRAVTKLEELAVREISKKALNSLRYKG